MITEKTTAILLQARDRLEEANSLINGILPDIDCPVCRSHVEEYLIYLNVLIRDMDNIRSITDFNIELRDNPELIHNLRNLIKHESALNLISIGSRLILRVRKLIRKNRSIEI